MTYDLHSHSTASDGTLSPTELVQRAFDKGVQVLALTDHDTTSGLAEAMQEAQRLGLQLIPGVEVSVTWETQVIHIVALGIDPNNGALLNGLENLRQQRHQRAVLIGKKLEAIGVEQAFEKAKAMSNGQLIGRGHFARVLIKEGLAKNFKQVFKRYLVKGKPGFVKGEWASLEEGLDWIHQAGGQSVIAHPARYRMNRKKLRRLIGDFVALGGCGFEVVSSSHSPDECRIMAGHAKDFGLLASKGSDFHEANTPWSELGRIADLPAGVIPIWQDWAVA